MIGLTDDSGAKLSLAYNGLTLNSSSDTIESTSANINTYVVDAVATHAAIDYTMEVNQQRSGVGIFNPRKAARVVTLRGRILAPSYAGLYDKIEALAAAFDPDTIAWKYGNDGMFLALTFSTPTLDTTNYATGFMACKYLCVPAAMPEPTIGPEGQSASFHVDLLMRDPRRYLVAQSTLSGSGNTTNLGDFRSWPTVTFSMTGAGNAAFTMTNTGTIQGAKSLVLDLSGLANTNAVIVDFEHKKVTVNGTETPGLYVSGTWWELEPGVNAIAHTNTSNTSTKVTTYYSAFSS